MSSNQYPMDFDSLKKGDRIEQSQIEEMFSVKAANIERYRFAQMQLCHLIEKNLVARGLIVTVRCEGEAVVVCTDEEAIDVNRARREQAIRRLAKSYRLASGIDRTQLTDEKKKELERNLYIASRELQAMARERREAKKALKGNGGPTPLIEAKD